MSRKEVVKVIKEVYDKGYHEGFEDACDLISTHLTGSIGNLISELKESAKEAKCEVFDEREVFDMKEEEDE